jgi:ABC-type Zn uptake system ZnuABC Zn-binding protein ZnuA
MFLLPARSSGNFQTHGHEGMELETMADYQAQAGGNSGYDAMKSGMQDQANWAWSGGKSNPGAASNAPFSRQAIEQMRRDSAAQMLTGPMNASGLSSGGSLASGGLSGPATVAISGADPHIWLDSMNAITMVDIITQRLSALYPNDARTYQNNAQAIQQRIADADADIRARMRYLAGKPFVVFHDAYQYFEKAFGLNASASVLLSPEVMPGAAHLMQVRDVITKSGAVCVFSEPQFDDALVTRVVGTAQVKRGVLDPEGAALADGPTLYPALLAQLADQFETCLK